MDAYSFKNTRPTLGMPAFDAASEIGAGVEDAIVVFLVVHWPGQAVTKHTLGQGRQLMGRVVPQKCGGRGGIAFAGVLGDGGLELVEFVLGYTSSN